MEVAPNPWVMINLYKNNIFRLSQQNEKHSSKRVVSMTYVLVKEFFAAATFKGF